MANSRHLKRHSMPISWPIKRKNITFITRPRPGSHQREYVTTVLVLLRDVLKYVKNAKEAKYVVNNEKFIVNGKEIKDIKAPVGLFDIVEVPSMETKCVMLFDNFGKIKLLETTQESVLLKVAGKTSLPGGKFQLNYMNGYNTLVDEKTFKTVSVEDTVVFDFKKKKTEKVMKLKEGNFVYVFDGKFQGQIGKIESFTNYNGLAVDTVVIKIGDMAHTTARAYCFVVGEKKEDFKELE